MRAKPVVSNLLTARYAHKFNCAYQAENGYKLLSTKTSLNNTVDLDSRVCDSAQPKGPIVGNYGKSPYWVCVNVMP